MKLGTGHRTGRIRAARRCRQVAGILSLLVGIGGVLAWLLLATWGGASTVSAWLYDAGLPRLGSSVLSAAGRTRPGTALAHDALRERAAGNIRAARKGEYPADQAVAEIWQDYRRVAGWGDESGTTSYACVVAYYLRVNGDAENALAIVNDALSRSPSDSQARRLIASRASVLYWGLGRYEEVIETFDRHIVARPERASRLAVGLVLASYRRLQRGGEGAQRLRRLAQAHRGTRLATEIRKTLQKTVYLCSAIERPAGLNATPEHAHHAAEVGDWIPKLVRVITSQEPAARETAALIGAEVDEADGRFDAIRPGLDGRRAMAEAERLQAEGNSVLQSWLGVAAVLDAIRPQARRRWEAVLAVAGTLPDGEAGLIVCEGRTIALALMAGTGDWSLKPIGGAELGPCDIVVLHLGQDGLAAVELLPINENARGRAWSDMTTWPVEPQVVASDPRDASAGIPGNSGNSGDTSLNY